MALEVVVGLILHTPTPQTWQSQERSFMRLSPKAPWSAMCTPPHPQRPA